MEACITFYNLKYEQKVDAESISYQRISYQSSKQSEKYSYFRVRIIKFVEIAGQNAPRI